MGVCDRGGMSFAWSPLMRGSSPPSPVLSPSYPPLDVNRPNPPKTAYAVFRTPPLAGQKSTSCARRSVYTDSKLTFGPQPRVGAEPLRSSNRVGPDVFPRDGTMTLHLFQSMET